MKNKQYTYEIPAVEITEFSELDIIVTSGLNGEDEGDDYTSTQWPL